MTQFERMIRSLPYKCDKECKELMNENKRKLYEYNNLPFERLSEQQSLLKNILGKSGDGIYIERTRSIAIMEKTLKWAITFTQITT